MTEADIHKKKLNMLSQNVKKENKPIGFYYKTISKKFPFALGMVTPWGGDLLARLRSRRRVVVRSATNCP